MKKAIVLFSGGLDSTTVLYYVRSRGFLAHCLIFDYGQRHKKEVLRAKRLAQKLKCPVKVVKITLPWKGSSLLDKTKRLPQKLNTKENNIPSTYVPARNIIFLSFAASFAEGVGASDIFIGANAIDYSGYPDCRPKFFQAFSSVLKSGLKTGVKQKPIKIHTPLIHKTKAQIVRLGQKLGVPFQWTWSCYAGGKLPCGKCDSCVLRARGFREANVKDSLL